jgi:DNA repair ATPase RecN
MTMSQLLKQFEEALHEFKQAQHDFNNAEFEFIDTAILKLQYTESRLATLHKQIKKYRGG